jgi:hypothetical protein
MRAGRLTFRARGTFVFGFQLEKQERQTSGGLCSIFGAFAKMVVCWSNGTGGEERLLFALNGCRGPSKLAVVMTNS